MAKSIFIFALLLNAASSWGASPIVEKSVEYKQGDTLLEGFVAYPKTIKGHVPAVLVVHEWNGLGDYVKKRARMLAEMGYIAFAADIYGKGVRPSSPEEAGKTATLYKNNRGLMRARARAGLDELLKMQNIDKTKIAAIGYCFGGTTALELARSGAPLAATISFHGGLSTPTPADAKNIKGKVLVLHGADDPSVPPTEVAAFEDEMRKGQVDWQLVAYGNTVHAFTNPSVPYKPGAAAGYNEHSDRRSWIAMSDFFKEVFGK